MKERPTLFSGDMVRAILAGRKTQTRRPIKTTDEIRFSGWPCDGDTGWKHPDRACRTPPPEGWHHVHYANGFHHADMPCPMGVPGDRLWVRETWGIGTRPCPARGWVDGVEYRADSIDAVDPEEEIPLHVLDPMPDDAEKWRGKWRPSIHMPRWASRLTLEVTDVRVQRVQDITKEDAIAEGFEPAPVHGKWAGARDDGGHWSARKPFADAWASIYGAESWERGDWCWAVTFKRL